MQIVIDIPEQMYLNVKKDMLCGADILVSAIANGTPLPKGHGRLIDADKISDKLEQLRDSCNFYGNEYESGMYNGYDRSLDEIDDAPTIIEADSEEDGLDNLDSMLEDLWDATESEGENDNQSNELQK